MAQQYQAIVIGTGFGGAVQACRLSKKWPGEVLVLERGKRYPMGTFPRAPWEVAQNFWNLPEERRGRPRKIRAREGRGMFDLRMHRHLDLVLGAGLGGGSLIYGNVFLMPPEEIFDRRWPASCARSKLLPYYEVAKQVLGSRPIPENGDPRREIPKTRLFEQAARTMGRPSRLVDINVFFGNDFSNPLPMGHQERNRYGAVQTSCVYCGECNFGCNYHAKNTLDLNYLLVAEQRYGAVIRTQHVADRIVPLGRGGEDDPAADGSFGYRVYYRDVGRPDPKPQSAVTKRVILAAGSLGSTEMLLRCKQVFRTLPRVSDRLGTSLSANGDFLCYAARSRQPSVPTYGPVITRGIDHNLLEDFRRDSAFILEDGGYPAFGAWFVEGINPGLPRLGSIVRTLHNWFDRLVTGTSIGGIGYAMGDIVVGDRSRHTSTLQFMGVDQSTGVMLLNKHGWLDIRWPYQDNLPLYRAILNAGRAFQRAVDAKDFIPMPTWTWPLRKNVTVHALGGCVLADDASRGVTSADPAEFGQVFGYRGLYVADGAIVPTAVGSNPTAAITALSEMVAESLTGIAPDADL